MNAYKVMKVSHKNGIKDGKKWDLITLIVELDDSFCEVNFWNIEVSQLPKSGDNVLINYELRKKQSFIFGKPIGFEIL